MSTDTMPEWALRAPPWWNGAQDARLVSVTGMYNSGRFLMTLMLHGLSNWPYLREQDCLTTEFDLGEFHREKKELWLDNSYVRLRYLRRLETLSGVMDALAKQSVGGSMRAIFVSSLFTKELRDKWLEMNPHHWLIWKEISSEELLRRLERKRLETPDYPFTTAWLKRYIAIMERPMPFDKSSCAAAWSFSQEERVLIVRGDNEETGRKAACCFGPVKGLPRVHKAIEADLRRILIERGAKADVNGH